MEKINVGQIVRGFGIKGEVKVKILTDFPDERFKVGSELFLQSGTNTLTVKIETLRYHQNHALLKFVDFPDLTSVERFHGCYLSVDSSHIEALDDQDVYRFQLIGMEAVTVDSTPLGTISEVMETGANDVLRIVGPEKTILVPYVPVFVINVDKSARKVIIKMMEGM